MRDHADNVVVVCSIENLDPMGVHTGDSITVAPALTLTDREYQRLRDIGIAIIREVGVDTGGCNIQFAVNPRDGRIIVIEMNPRVSRSSALASKATGFPIAKIAAQDGHRLHPRRDPQRHHPRDPGALRADASTTSSSRCRGSRSRSSRPPTPTLTTTMKSVGEAMAIGRNFTEALQKALRSLETQGSQLPLGRRAARRRDAGARAPRAAPGRPTDGRIVAVQQALRGGASVEEVHEATGIDPWFLDQIALIDDVAEPWSPAARARRPTCCGWPSGTASPTPRSPRCAGMPEAVVRGVRHALGVRPVYKTVDTCAAEFAALTPYHYSPTTRRPRSPRASGRRSSSSAPGPNRIGQGVEFDYSCVHASFALRDAGYDTVMVNCNPETVSTDYDTSSRLYFEPLTLEDVLEVVHAEQQAGPIAGVIVQLGGQTPLGLAKALKAEGVPIVGTTPEAIDLAEDRGAFGRVLAEAEPAGAEARHGLQRRRGASRSPSEIGYPVLVRPSYVLGGRGMEIVYDDETLIGYVDRAPRSASPEHPVLVDRFLDDAIEIDVDALYDGTEMYLGGIMEHIEEAGIHSGDSRLRAAAGHPRRRRARAGPRVDAQARRGHRRARA